MKASLLPAKSSPCATSSAGGVLRRKCSCGDHAGTCESCRRQRATVPSIVHDVLRSPGQPLDSEVREFMEPRFGHDFSGVGRGEVSWN